MIQPVYYNITANDFIRIETQEGYPDHIGFNIILSNTEDLNANLFQSLIQGSNPFLITLNNRLLVDLQHNSGLSFIQKITSASKYGTRGGHKIILIDNFDNQLTDAALKAFESFFVAHDDKVMSLCYDSKADDINTNNKLNKVLLLTKDLIGKSSVEHSIFNQFLYMNQPPIVLLDGWMELSSTGPAIDKAYLNYSKEVEAVFQSRFLNEHYAYENTLLKNRSILYLEFIAVSKEIREKEYFDLLDWYHKEYEVLPLWYKRFGHIVKVMKGKRSFRTLISDNIQKRHR